MYWLVVESFTTAVWQELPESNGKYLKEIDTTFLLGISPIEIKQVEVPRRRGLGNGRQLDT